VSGVRESYRNTLLGWFSNRCTGLSPWAHYSV